MRMGISMLVNGRTISLMVKVLTYLRAGRDMKVNFITDSSMVKEVISMLMEMFLKENGQKIGKMDMAFSIIRPKENYTRVTFLMAKNMERESSNTTQVMCKFKIPQFLCLS